MKYFGISLEFLAWTGLLLIINIVFLIITTRYQLASYHALANDASIRINGASDGQKLMQRMRWITLVIIILRVAFIILCGINNGKLASEHSLNWNDLLYSIYMVTYYLLQSISYYAKVIFIIIAFQSMAPTLFRIYAMNELRFRLDSKKYKRLRRIKYGGYLCIFCIVIQCTAEMVLWILNDEHLYKSFNVGWYALIYSVYWLSLSIFSVSFYNLRSRAMTAYYKHMHAMPEYKKIHFKSVMDRLQHTMRCFVCWFFLYLLWSWVDLAHHILNEFDIWSNRFEYHMALYWLYFVVVDSLLVITILCYIKPQISASVGLLQKYSRPINKRRHVSEGHIY